MTTFTIYPIENKKARQVVVDNHYTHMMPQAVKSCWGLFCGEEVLGVVVYSIPANRFVFSCLGLPNGWELSRAWMVDGLPNNTLSWFISTTLRAIPIEYVVSFADPQFGHVGYIYQALNFIYIGKTQPEKRYKLPDGKLITRRSLGRKKGVSEKQDRLVLLSQGAIEFLSCPKYKYLYIRNKKARKYFLAKTNMLPYPKIN